MSGAIIYTPGTGDDWATAWEQAEYARKGKMGMSIEILEGMNYVGAGSWCEVAGSIYKWAYAEAPTGSRTTDTINYIKLVPSGSGDTAIVTATNTTTAPTWSDAYQGWYDGTSRYVGYSFYDGSVSRCPRIMGGSDWTLTEYCILPIQEKDWYSIATTGSAVWGEGYVSDPVSGYDWIGTQEWQPPYDTVVLSLTTYFVTNGRNCRLHSKANSVQTFSGGTYEWATSPATGLVTSSVMKYTPVSNMYRWSVYLASGSVSELRFMRVDYLR